MGPTLGRGSRYKWWRPSPSMQALTYLRRQDIQDQSAVFACPCRFSLSSDVGEAVLMPRLQFPARASSTRRAAARPFVRLFLPTTRESPFGYRGCNGSSSLRAVFFAASRDIANADGATPGFLIGWACMHSVWGSGGEGKIDKKAKKKRKRNHISASDSARNGYPLFTIQQIMQQGIQ